MRIEVIRDSSQRALKDYVCDACHALLDGMVYPDEFTPEEVEIMKSAQSDGWKIKKGQIYSKQVNKFDGELGVFRSRPEIEAIYFKYDMTDF